MTEVIIVLDNVSLIEIFVNSKIFISENFLKFSLTLSNMEVVKELLCMNDQIWCLENHFVVGI